MLALCEGMENVLKCEGSSHFPQSQVLQKLCSPVKLQHNTKRRSKSNYSEKVIRRFGWTLHVRVLHHGGYTLVSRPFMSMEQCSLSLCFRWRGGTGGIFLSGGGGRTPSSSCMRRATSGETSSGLPPAGSGWKLPLFCWQFTCCWLRTGFFSQIRGT